MSKYPTYEPFAGHSTLRRALTRVMTTYDSVECGAADESDRRRPRTFTLTQLLVACVAVCACTLGAMTMVNTHNRALADADADERARAHRDYVYIHEELTACGEKLAAAQAAACENKGA